MYGIVVRCGYSKVISGRIEVISGYFEHAQTLNPKNTYFYPCAAPTPCCTTFKNAALPCAAALPNAWACAPAWCALAFCTSPLPPSALALPSTSFSPFGCVLKTLSTPNEPPYSTFKPCLYCCVPK